MLKIIKLVFTTFMIGALLSSCSKVINTANGLSTFQSTIAGSNYPFTVDKNGKLSEKYESVDAEKLIGNGDNFSINLDSLFLRYLQASDPYIVVYSEAWMGSDVRPSDDNLLQRQILLLKDGEGFNSRLPINWIPLLGPVTMENDGLDVYVSLNVVVLSKNDNKQTTQLLDGLASAAGTVAPQYALIAGAAASIGKAIVAQNRDKVEFEHTFNLSPRTGLKQVFKAKDVIGELEPPLAESKLIVIKGENEHRLVPYQNWFYYIWPLNWLGHKPSNNTIRFEHAHQHYKNPLADNIFPNFIDEGATYTLVNIPFKILSELLIPNDSYLLQKETTSPDNLTMKGGYLMKDPANGSRDEKMEDNFLHSLYSEKTHVILTIKKTDGSYGNFNQLKTKFSAHTNEINKLLSDKSSSESAISEAFESIKKAVIYEQRRNKVVELAKTSAVGKNILDNVLNQKDENGKDVLDTKDKIALTNIFWKELSTQSGKRLKTGLDNILELVMTKKITFTEFYDTLNNIVAHEKNTYWNQCDMGDKSDINLYWFNVLQTVSDYLFQLKVNNEILPKVTDLLKSSNLCEAV